MVLERAKMNILCLCFICKQFKKVKDLHLSSVYICLQETVSVKDLEWKTCRFLLSPGAHRQDEAMFRTSLGIWERERWKEVFLLTVVLKSTFSEGWKLVSGWRSVHTPIRASPGLHWLKLREHFPKKVWREVTERSWDSSPGGGTALALAELLWRWGSFSLEPRCDSSSASPVDQRRGEERSSHSRALDLHTDPQLRVELLEEAENQDDANTSSSLFPLFLLLFHLLLPLLYFT